MSTHAWVVVAAALVAGADAPKDKPAQKPRPDPVKIDLAKLQGTWAVTSVEYQGKKVPRRDYQGLRLVITPGVMATKRGGRTVSEAGFTISPTRKPRAIDWKTTLGPKKGQKGYGIYAVEGDTLQICGADDEADRPRTFATKPDSKQTLLVLKRVKP